MSDETTTTDNRIEVPAAVARLVDLIGLRWLVVGAVVFFSGGSWGINDLLALATGQVPPALTTAEELPPGTADCSALALQLAAVEGQFTAEAMHAREMRLAIIPGLGRVRAACNPGGGE